MAHVKVIPGKYLNEDAVDNVVEYIFRLCENDLIGGFGIYPIEANSIIEQYKLVKKIYNQEEGRQIKHFEVSFDNKDRLSKSDVYKLAPIIASYFKNEFQIIYAVHDDTKNLHIHFALNTVSFVDGHKYDGEDLEEFIQYVNNVCS